MITLKYWNSLSESCRTLILGKMGICDEALEKEYHHKFNYNSTGKKLKAILGSMMLKNGKILVTIQVTPKFSSPKPLKCQNATNNMFPTWLRKKLENLKFNRTHYKALENLLNKFKDMKDNIKNNKTFSITLSFDEMQKISPRKVRRKEQYDSLVKNLKLLGIELKVNMKKIP